MIKKITEIIDKKKDYLPYLLIAAFYLLFVIVFIRYCGTVLDSDMSSEMILADLLNKEHVLISKNWAYGNELRVFNLQLLFKLFLYIFPNKWLYARYASQCVLMLLYALSTIFCVHSIGFGRKGVYIAAILILPISYWNVFHNYFGGFYLIFAIPMLLLTGLVFKISRNEKINKLLLVILAIASLLTGMNGMKVILYFCVPNLFTAFIMFILCMKYEGIYIYIYKKKFEYRYLISSIVSTIFLIAGFVIYKLLNNIYTIEPTFQFSWLDFDLNIFIKNFSLFLWNFGYPGSEAFRFYVVPTKLKGFFGVFSIITIFAFNISIIRLIKNCSKLSILNKYIFVLSMSSIFITVFVLAFTLPSINGSYYLPLLPYAFILIELEICTDSFVVDWFRNILRFCLVMTVALSSITNLNLYIKMHPRKDSDIDKVVDYLNQSDINCVFAEFWNGNVITELTNGKVEIVSVEDTNSLTPVSYLQKKKHFLPYSGEVYVLLDDRIEINETFKSDEIEIIFSNGYSLIKAKNISVYKNNINNIIIAKE